jgi:CTP synthase (UTP-ammonia lyase)
MVGKYVQIRDSYISLNEALMHGGLKSARASTSITPSSNSVGTR